MPYIRQTLLALCVTVASLGALAQNPEVHKRRNPENTLSSTVNVNKTTTGKMNPGKMAAMDQHMKAMQAMHEKMMAAKNPQERQKLMAEHMKLMQGGISMMKQMGSQS